MLNGATYPGMYGTYGSSGPVHDMHHMHMLGKGGYKHPIRQKLNAAAILVSLSVPSLLFCSMHWLMSFSLHYNHPFECYFLVLLGLVFVGLTALFALEAMSRKKDTDSAVEFMAGGNLAHHTPTWAVFLFLTCFLAWVAGLMAGDMNFNHHMSPYYDVANLNTYQNVNASEQGGQQFMDVGRIMFSEGSQLNLTLSAGFKNVDDYCVAPIVSSSSSLPTYDFWAVGVNCCPSQAGDTATGINWHFNCGEFDNKRAHAGLRLMKNDQRAYYMLAVRQAEAKFDIKAYHPLFFHWMQDPIAEVNSYMDDGWRSYTSDCFLHFIFQLFLVLIACCCFSKMGALS
jgi:hypothetical protein